MRPRDGFATQVKPLIAAGADVIVPASGLPMLPFARGCPSVIDGPPSVGGIAVVAKAAETAPAGKITEVVVDRRATDAKAAPEAIREFLPLRPEAIAAT